MDKLLVILGPTGVGKTNLALKLAKKFNAELISVDSRQIYTDMDIGTGKLPVISKIKSASRRKKENGKWIIDGVPIYLYDITTPDKTFSVAAYQQLAYQTIRSIHQKGKLPILVGGTALYLNAVTQGLNIPKVPPNKDLRNKLERTPLGELLKKLEEIDPKTFARIDKQNPRRIIRALEIYYSIGQPLSTLTKKFKVDYDILTLGLTCYRDYLYNLVDKRVEAWIKNGFLDEVKNLRKKYGDVQVFNSPGYRQISNFLDKKISLEEAIKRIKFDHHSLIRKQYTFFKRNKKIIWFDIGQSNFQKQVQDLVNEWYNN